MGVCVESLGVRFELAGGVSVVTPWGLGPLLRRIRAGLVIGRAGLPALEESLARFLFVGPAGADGGAVALDVAGQALAAGLIPLGWSLPAGQEAAFVVEFWEAGDDSGPRAAVNGRALLDVRLVADVESGAFVVAAAPWLGLNVAPAVSGACPRGGFPFMLAGLAVTLLAGVVRDRARPADKRGQEKR